MKTTCNEISAPAKAIPAWQTPEERERRRHARDLNRNFYRRRSIDLSNPIRAAVDYLLPWGFRAYPGRLRGFWQALGHRISKPSAEAIYYGARPGRWVYWRLLELVRQQIEFGRLVEAALVAEIERLGPPKLRGLQIRDDDGLPKYRWRGGRKKTEQEAGDRKPERKI